MRRQVEEVMRRILDEELLSARTSGGEVRSPLLIELGDGRMKFIVPTGYESLVNPLVEEHGDRLIVEFTSDVWKGYPTLNDR